MNHKRDVKALDFAINRNGNYLILEKDKRFVLGTLIKGDYIRSSGNLGFGKGEVIDSVRGISFPNVINGLEKSIARDRNMRTREIKFVNDELFTNWILDNGQISFYPKDFSDDEQRFVEYEHQELGRKRDIAEVSNNHSLIKGREIARVEQVKKIGVYRVIYKSAKKIENMFNDNQRIGFDILGENYSFFSGDSLGFLGALVKIQDKLRMINI